MLSEEDMRFAVDLAETLSKLKRAAETDHAINLTAPEVKIVVRAVRLLSQRPASSGDSGTAGLPGEEG